MNSTGRFLLLGLGLIVWCSGGVASRVEAAPPQAASAAATPVPAAPGLAWDAVTKEYTSQPNERFAQFTFWFTNTASGEVLIRSATSTCFCTVAKLPMQPWRIPPGSNGTIEVTMDLAGKSGTVMKGVSVDSSAGFYQLIVKTTIPPSTNTGTFTVDRPAMKEADRLKNVQTALADRQAVFKRAECASCHAAPAKGRSDGGQLYAGVCANCHDSPLRASAVPDLHTLTHPTDREHWKRWIAFGRAGSMMPAFAAAEGGPLSDPQINAIADYLTRTIPSRVTP